MKCLRLFPKDEKPAAHVKKQVCLHLEILVLKDGVTCKNCGIIWEATDGTNATEQSS